MTENVTQRALSPDPSEHAHPFDATVALGVIGLLLDDERAVLVAAVEAVRNALRSANEIDLGTPTVEVWRSVPLGL